MGHGRQDAQSSGMGGQGWGLSGALGFLGGLPQGAQSPGDCGPAPLSAALPLPLGDAVTLCLNPDPDSQSLGALHLRVSPLKMHVKSLVITHVLETLAPSSNLLCLGQ